LPYADFIEEVCNKKALIRIAGSGRIAKLAKGKYHKSERTPFINLQPNHTQLTFTYHHIQFAQFRSRRAISLQRRLKDVLANFGGSAV
jgi:hypothetical protein